MSRPRAFAISVVLAVAILLSGCNNRQTPTATPTLTPAPSPSPSATPIVETPDEPPFPAPPDRDLYALARRLKLRSQEPIPRVVNPEPVSYSEGRRDTFWAIDLDENQPFQVKAVLRKVSPHAYFYVEEGLPVSSADLDRAAQAFEERIYPRVTGLFGTEWTPGVDNDPHLTILHARIPAVAGYYSSPDEYPDAVYSYSNEREMIYINVSGLRLGTGAYLATLAHELQHAVHWNADPTEETWVNEGLSELAVELAGYNPSFLGYFLAQPDTQLNAWAEGQASLANYGAAYLFMRYLYDHYGSQEGLKPLVAEPLDGADGIDAYLVRAGYGIAFEALFRDWVIANYLDLPGDGRYSYPYNSVSLPAERRFEGFGAYEGEVSQYAANYIEVALPSGDATVVFQGQPDASLGPVPYTGPAMWWSQRGDGIDPTLTAEVDLSRLEKATLSFQTWFDIEEEWDYAYVEASTDGGLTWDILRGQRSSDANPVGNSFGPGYTGSSGGGEAPAWVQERIDLSPYAGKKVMLRFEYVTDEAIHRIGLFLDDIAIPELGRELSWQADGFVYTTGLLPQRYAVQLITFRPDGPVVERVPLDDDNRGQVTIRGFGQEVEKAVLVVSALDPYTLTPAGYSVTLAP